jgi:peroxiredoxin
MKKINVCLFAVVMLLFAAGGACAQENTASDFELQDLSGISYSLSDYREKQIVMLFFWTTWCPYCQQEIKALDREQESLAAADIRVFTVNAGERPAKVRDFVNRANVSLQVLLDERGRVSDSYHIIGVPTFVLVDKQGGIIYTGSRYPAREVRKMSSK